MMFDEQPEGTPPTPTTITVRVCPACDGEGNVYETTPAPPTLRQEQGQPAAECLNCGGQGYLNGEACNMCDGTGDAPKPPEQGQEAGGTLDTLRELLKHSLWLSYGLKRMPSLPEMAAQSLLEKQGMWPPPPSGEPGAAAPESPCAPPEQGQEALRVRFAWDPPTCGVAGCMVGGEHGHPTVSASTPPPSEQPATQEQGQLSGKED